MELWGREISRDDLAARVGRLEQVAGVRLVTLADGASRGVRVLEFDVGGGLRFDVLVDRAFDIGACSFRGMPLAWISPVGITGPWYRETPHLGFLRTFGGGLLTTCGLDHTLFPEEDTAEQFAFPPRAVETYPLHGRLSTLPARLVGYGDAWRGGDCVLWAEGEIEQVSVFGERLVLRRRIETVVGSTALTLSDEVANLGYAPTSHMLLYHVNAGWPIVDEGSVLLADSLSVEARGEGSVDDHHLLGPPRLGATEQVFEQRLRPQPDGSASVAVANLVLGLGLYQRFPVDALPYHIVWRMLGRTHYVVGIEPSTNAADGRVAARRRGELVELAPGEVRSSFLELGVLDGREAIDDFAIRVRSRARLFDP